MKLRALILIVLLLTACARQATPKPMYTYNVQYVDFRYDEVKEMGPVDEAGALRAFENFPFDEQLKKAETVETPTFPTISYRSASDGDALAVWSIETGKYQVYMEHQGRKVTIDTQDRELIAESIKAFLAGEHESLFKKLAVHPSATLAEGLLHRLKSIFSA